MCITNSSVPQQQKNIHQTDLQPVQQQREVVVQQQQQARQSMFAVPQPRKDPAKRCFVCSPVTKMEKNLIYQCSALW
jgi:hypothetical protein